MLPSAARGSWGELTDWQLRAVKAAGAEICELRDGVPVEELRAAAVRGVQSVTKAFEAEQVAKKDAEMRARVVRWARLPSWMSPEGRETVEKLIEQTFAALPVGTPQARLEQQVQQVLADLEEAVREREAQAKAKEPVRNEVVTTSPKAAPKAATGGGLRPIPHRAPR